MDADVLFVGFLALFLGAGKVAVRWSARGRFVLLLTFVIIVPPALPLFSQAISLPPVTVGLLFVWCTTLGATYGWLAGMLTAEK